MLHDLIHIRDWEAVANRKSSIAVQYMNSFLRPFCPQFQCFLLTDQNKFIRHQLRSLRALILMDLFITHNPKFDNKRIFDAKNCIGRFIRISVKIKRSGRLLLDGSDIHVRLLTL